MGVDLESCAVGVIGCGIASLGVPGCEAVAISTCSNFGRFRGVDHFWKSKGKGQANP